MRTKRRIFAILMAMALLISMIPTFKVSAAIKLSKSKATMEVDSKLTLKLGKVAYADVKWKTGNKKVATVSSKGVITAKGEGNTTITATYKNKKYNCSVMVVDSNKKPKKEEGLKGKVDVIAEYTIPDGIGWYTRRFLIVKNNTNKTVDISTSTLAYGLDGNLVSGGEGELVALGAGCTSVFYEAFETGEEIGRYDMTMDFKESKYYKSVIQDLSYVQNDIDGGAIFQVTNNGKDVAEFVHGYALFFKNGELIGYNEAYFTDDDYEIKSGKTISKQIDSYEEFDKIEFYLTGRK